MLKLISYSGIFVAFGAVSYSIYYSKLLNASIDPYRTLLIFFATIASYSGVQIVPLLFTNAQQPRQEWFLKYKKFFFVLISSSLVIVASLSFYLSKIDFFIFSHLFILVLFYEKNDFFKFISFKRTKGIKEIKGIRSVAYLKSPLIAYVWATTCCFPQILQQQTIHTLGVQAFLIWAESFSFILALTIPFDIRDSEHDKKYQLKTLMHLLGIKKVKILCIGLMTFSLSVSLVFHNANVMASMLILVMYCYFLIKAKSSLHDYYFFFGLDSLIILKLLFIL